MNLIKTMTDAIVITRDFCGNESQAAIDAGLEAGFSRREIAVSLHAAAAAADNEWRECQKAAGVGRRHWR